MIPIVALFVSTLIPTVILAKENDKRDDSATQTSLGEISFRHNDVVTFMGGTNMVNAMKAGYLETLLSKRNASLSLKFRDYSWDADTVFGQGTVIEQWRKKEFGNIIKQLKKAGTTVLVLQFGKMESMQGRAGLVDFV
ncbi:MAG: hypothetical protein IID32_03705, partial [Planctomycetes bacterium]|nr:hypothetical protein [Planctomycetota bacterium]